MPSQRRLWVQLFLQGDLLLRASLSKRVFNLEVNWGKERPDLRSVYYPTSCGAERAKRTGIQQKPILISTIYVFFQIFSAGSFQEGYKVIYQPHNYRIDNRGQEYQFCPLPQQYSKSEGSDSNFNESYFHSNKTRPFVVIRIYFNRDCVGPSLQFIFKMCQGLGCHNCNDCIYYNYYGDCVGISVAMYCFSCWSCPPKELEDLRHPGVCKCQSDEGCGHNCLNYGGFLCPPDYLKEYSLRRSIGERRGPIYNLLVTQQPNIQRQMMPPQINHQFR